MGENKLYNKDMIVMGGFNLLFPEQLAYLNELEVEKACLEVSLGEIEPLPGVYHWNLLNRFIGCAQKEGITLYIKIKISSYLIQQKKEYLELLEELLQRTHCITKAYIISIDQKSFQSNRQLSIDTIRSFFRKEQTKYESKEACIDFTNYSYKEIEALLSIIKTEISPFICGVLVSGDEVEKVRELVDANKIKNGLSVWVTAKPQSNCPEDYTESEHMCHVVYEMLRLLESGAGRIIWPRLEDEKNIISGLVEAGKINRKPSFYAFQHMVGRIFPFIDIKCLERDRVFAYEIIQDQQQKTTVVWSQRGTHEEKWKIDDPVRVRIYDLCGSIAANPHCLLVNQEPLYIVENAQISRESAKMNIGKYDRINFYNCHPILKKEEMMARNPDIKAGWDWWLPDWVKPEPYSGYFNFAQVPCDDIRIIGWHPSWKEWHTGPGEYDFSSLEQKLDNARKNGYRIGMRLQSVVRDKVPDWIVEKYNPPVATLSGRFAFKIVAPWDDNVQREFENFVHELGKRGYHKEDVFVFASIHGISHSLGEEFSLPFEDVSILENEAGLTSKKFHNWVIGRIDAWADAFAGYEYKLGWVGNSGEWPKTDKYDYSGIAKEAVLHSIKRGCGNRAGFVEMYNYLWNDPVVGQSRSEDGYLTTDEDFPVVLENRYFADENEEYGIIKRWRFGLHQNDCLRWRMSILRSLQMRRNFIATHPMALDIDRELSEYARLSFGKNIHSTPDAWCYLREAYVRDIKTGKALELKNFERWLYQRDIEGGITKPAWKLERDYSMPTDPAGIQYEYNARRTDYQSGNRYIYFKLDNRLEKHNTYMAKVTYLDDTCTKWRIEYNSKDSVAMLTPTVHCQGDGEIRTATLMLHEVDIRGALPGEHDFRIYNEGHEDLTVLFVRIIRK